ncbi:fructose-1-phosphate kinase [Clostridium sp. CAG:632]|mgnify:FL=1|jgi:1-phosphofructokinase|nr:1-phosphofructokinase [Clostridium sp.]CCY58438.1 fructose-1-phosphate kinase [Clostridium sp. CAG:632]
MIYTVTLNPALDYIMHVEHFEKNRINKTSSELLLPGGKGINVSIVLHNLGMSSTALGFIAGFTGQEIRRKLQGLGVTDDFIELPDGHSRINMKICSHEETELNGMGPIIDEASLLKLYTQLDRLVTGDVLVLAGSIPASLPDNIYQDIMKRVEAKGVMTIVDARKDLLENVLELRPFLIKPNNFELAELFGLEELWDKQEVLRYAKELQERGARNVLVSMAGAGAVLAAEDGSTYESPAPDGTVINSVGAGDSMVAGFLYGLLTTESFEQAFYTGLACGSASAFSEQLATKDAVDAILKHLI